MPDEPKRGSRELAFLAVVALLAALMFAFVELAGATLKGDFRAFDRAAMLVAAIGLSRVYLDVHWPTDVVAGWAVGAGWALLCCAVAFRLTGRGPPPG